MKSEGERAWCAYEVDDGKCKLLNIDECHL